MKCKNVLDSFTSRKDVFAAAEEVGHVERNDSRRERSEHDRSEARPSWSEDHAQLTYGAAQKRYLLRSMPFLK